MDLFTEYDNQSFEFWHYTFIETSKIVMVSKINWWILCVYEALSQVLYYRTYQKKKYIS